MKCLGPLSDLFIFFYLGGSLLGRCRVRSTRLGLWMGGGAEYPVGINMSRRHVIDYLYMLIAEKEMGVYGGHGANTCKYGTWKR